MKYFFFYSFGNCAHTYRKVLLMWKGLREKINCIHMHRGYKDCIFSTAKSIISQLVDYEMTKWKRVNMFMSTFLHTLVTDLRRGGFIIACTKSDARTSRWPLNDSRENVALKEEEKISTKIYERILQHSRVKSHFINYHPNDFSTRWNINLCSPRSRQVENDKLSLSHVLLDRFFIKLHVVHICVVECPKKFCYCS